MEADGRITSVAFESLTKATGFRKLAKKVTAEEMAASTAELVEVDRQILAAEEEKKETVKELSEGIKLLKARQADVLETIGTGERVAEVQIEEGYDWTAGKKYLRRQDTGEMLEPEEIKEVERQMMLAGLEPSQFAEALERDWAPEPNPDDADLDNPDVEATAGIPIEGEESGEPLDVSDEEELQLKNDSGEPITCVKCGGYLKKADREFGICPDCDKKNATEAPAKKRGKKAGF
jgi:hypothetical protein